MYSHDIIMHYIIEGIYIK